MKILVVGGTGIIGNAVVSLLRKEHEVIAVGKTNGDYQIDIENQKSVDKMFEEIKDIDGVISITGDAIMSPVYEQKNRHIELAINSKLKANINILCKALKHVNESGFVILTTGAASHTYIPGASLITMANAGLEAYVKAIQIEKNNNVRVNIVSPSTVTETVEKLNLNFPNTVSAANTAEVYKAMVETNESGVIARVDQYFN